TAKQASHRPGIAPALCLRAGNDVSSFSRRPGGRFHVYYEQRLCSNSREVLSMSKASFDSSSLQAAIRTTEYPHRTVCMVRGVTDTHVEAQFWVQAEHEWVMLPLKEIASFKVLRQVDKVTTGEYSLVELGLNDEHPVTEIEALQAQVRYM